MEGHEASPRRVRQRACDPAFVGALALLFAAGAAATILAAASTASMGEMPMAGGWSLSMMWMRLCGQSWNPAALSFLGMWMAMMVAMMLPALAPMLQRYRRALAAMGGMHPGWPTALAGAGYFGVWAVCGMAVYLPGAALATRAMADPATARVLPFAAGALVVLGSALQFTAWKARQLACCRAAPGVHCGRAPSLPFGTACIWGCAACVAAAT